MSEEQTVKQDGGTKKAEAVRKTRYRPTSPLEMLKTPTTVYSMIAIYVGLGLAYRPVREYVFNTFDLYTLVGVIVAVAGVATAVGVSVKSQRRLVDVDDERERERSKGIHIDHLFPTRQSDMSKDQFRLVVDQFNEPNSPLESRLTGPESEKKQSETQESKLNQELAVTATSFTSYFAAIAQTLEEKARDAEKKASILLDRGASYTKWGVFFFISSIIAWQVLCLVHEFRTEYIYGIASCSALFIFIEFLSAWFLKQYRHYVDTATYIIKIKSIFDRYLLVYLATRTNEALDENAHARAQALIDMLAADIRWPDSYLLKSADVGFAKEAIEAISTLATQLKKEKKNAKKNVNEKK